MVPLETEAQVNFLLSRGAPTVLVAAVALCGATAATDKLTLVSLINVLGLITILGGKLSKF